MRDVFDVVFMGRGNAGSGPGRRRGFGGSGSDVRREWLAYLERGFAENRPWDRTVRDMVLARPETAADRGSIWFLYGGATSISRLQRPFRPPSSGSRCSVRSATTTSWCGDPAEGLLGLVAFFSRGKNLDTAQGPTVSEAAIGGFTNFATLAGQSFPAELTFLGRDVPEVRPAADVKEMDAPALYQPSAPGSTSSSRVPLFSRRARATAGSRRTLSANCAVARKAVPGRMTWEPGADG